MCGNSELGLDHFEADISRIGILVKSSRSLQCGKATGQSVIFRCHRHKFVDFGHLWGALEIS